MRMKPLVAFLYNSELNMVTTKSRTLATYIVLEAVKGWGKLDESLVSYTKRIGEAIKAQALVESWR
jgi:hypothetical protein